MVPPPSQKPILERVEVLWAQRVAKLSRQGEEMIVDPRHPNSKLPMPSTTLVALKAISPAVVNLATRLATSTTFGGNWKQPVAKRKLPRVVPLAEPLEITQYFGEVMMGDVVFPTPEWLGDSGSTHHLATNAADFLSLSTIPVSLLITQAEVDGAADKIILKLRETLRVHD